MGGLTTTDTGDTMHLRYTRIPAGRTVRGLEYGEHVTLGGGVAGGYYVRPTGTEQWAVARLTPADDECWDTDAETVAAIRAEIEGGDESDVFAAVEDAQAPAWDGRRLAEAREARGLTQGELGERLGIGYQQVSAWERGERTPGAESLVKLARALDVSADRLLGMGS